MIAGRVSVAEVTAANLPAFLTLMGDIEAKRLPADPDASARAEAEARLSLSRFDFTRSTACRVLLASVGASAAGYALVVRIPKADARVGFLYVDELYVLALYRRMGVAAALLAQCESVARDWGLHGIRLLVRPENDTARQLYRGAGYSESTTTFCEKILA